ncbi:MAG: tripartite tricarboxylate transporter substrate binding protein [Burkholderiales bacterium]|nr:tripartite tricarboxylate transporter substrate binding protein [Burkholderiales bacterium]
MGARAIISILILLGAMVGPLGAQSYPSKQIRLILPFPPGGPTDILGRAIGQKLSEQIGHPVVIDNRPGAGGNLGVEVASKSPPDGYTIVLSSPLIAISPSLYAKLNYDPIRDLAPISLVATIQNLMIVHPSVPAKTLKEFIQLARSNPNKLNFGSGGVGTTTHLASELLKSLANIKMVHVPFKGTGQAMVGLMGGQVDMLVIAVPPTIPQIQAGKIRPLAVLSDRRASALPNVPTAKEAGVDNYEVPIWYGILAPAGTPAGIVATLNQELTKALTSADLRKRLAAVDVEPLTSTPEQFASFIKSETVRYAAVVKASGAKAD